LLLIAAKTGLDKQVLEQTYPRADEIGFTNERKMMTTLHASYGGHIAYSKGATETGLARPRKLRSDFDYSS
jgi:Ca2+-transporting ATPase